jgi:hypothetical protein
MIQRATAIAFVAIVIAACGGSASPPASPEASAEPAAAKGAEGHPAKSLADIRRGFIESCSSRVPNAPDYCECSWEQMTKTFSEAEMNADGEDKEKLEQFRARVEGVCRSKLPEGLIKSSFLKSCSGDDPKVVPYCECTFAEFRKSMSVADLADPATAKTERFTAARKAAVKVCGAKLPEQVVHDGFVAGCAKEEKLKPFCDCAWKQIRKEKSAAELEAGLVDMDAMRPNLEKGCGKLRPAK